MTSSSADADLRPYLQTFRMPVAIMVGEEDRATPPEMARRLREAIPHSTLMMLPGARHLTPIECPDRISSQLLTVLRRS
jgi:3-oxoadipate enol-lactonase